MPFLQILKQVLSTRSATWAILLMAVAGKVLQVLYFTDPGGDKPFQVLATQNLLDGKGITTLQVFAADLSNPQFTPLIKWPPGYSLLLTPFYTICGENAWWGTAVFDALCAVLLLIACRQTVALFKLQRWQLNLFTFATGFFLYSFIQASTSDIQGALLFQLEIYCTVRFFQSENKSWWLVAAITLLAFAAGLTRYMLLPASFVAPLYFIWCGRLNQNRRLLQQGLFMFLVLALLNASLLWWQQTVAGSAAYVIPSEKGFFPGNLLRLHTFILSAFTHTELLAVQLSKWSGLSYAAAAWMLIVVNWLLILVIFWMLVKWVVQKRLLQPSLQDHFVYLHTGKTLALLGVLFYLSVSQAPVQMNEEQNWTFVQEGRYYFMPVLFLQQYLFIYAAGNESRLSIKVRKLLTGVLVIFLLFALHGLAFTFKNSRNNHHHVQQETMQYFKQQLALLQKDNPRRSIVVTGHEQSYMLFAGLWYGLPYLEDYTVVNTSRVHTKAPVTIVVCIRDKFAHLYQNFLANPEKKQLGRINDYSFYSLAAEPK